MKQIFKISFLAVSVLLLSTTAFAATKTATMAVTTNIISACNISVMPLDFGNYDPVGVNKTTALNGATTITALCVNELPATISLDEGLYKDTGSGAGTPLRRMQCTDIDGSYISYTLYQDSAHTQVWGAGTSAMAYTGSGGADTMTVYGQIAPGQATETGGFTDTVTVTISY